MSFPVLQDDVIQKIRRLEDQAGSMHYYTEADFGTNVIYNYHITTGAVTSDAIANATITATDIASATIVAANIANATITSTQIANATIIGGNIASGTITGTHIQDASISGTDIGTGVITGTNIGTATITSTHIQDATIQGADIASATIAAGNIVNATITATQIANATITATQIANATITSGQIANATITGTNIATGTITSTNIQDATITGGDIASATIQGGNIQTGTITSTNIQDATILGADIGTGTITSANIQDASIVGADIGSATITGANIGSATITGGNISNATITGGNIGSNTVTAGNITDLTITSAEIADLTIVGAKIAAATLTADKITVTSLSALSANLGTITAGNITGVTITGVTFQTSSTNPRVFMDSTGIGAIQSDGTASFKLDASTGKLSTLSGIGGFNLFSNASFEDPQNSLSGWTTQDIANNYLQPVNSPVYHGSKAIKITRQTGAGSVSILPSNPVKILPTKDYTLSTALMVTTEGKSAYIANGLMTSEDGVSILAGDTAFGQPLVEANKYTLASASFTSPSLYANATKTGMATGLMAYWRMSQPTDTYTSTGIFAGSRMWYKFNETSGTQVIDSSGNANHATYVGSPTFGITGVTPHDTDKAVQFNGTNAGVSMPSIHAGTSQDVLTVSFWLWWDAYANDGKYAVYKPGDGSNSGNFYVQPNHSSGTLRIGFTGNVGFNNAFAQFTRPTAAAWHHYVIAISTAASPADTMSVYIDGVLATPTSSDLNVNHTNLGPSGTTYLMYDGASSFSAGRMDEFCSTWFSLWTAAQARNAYRIGKAYIKDETTNQYFLRPSISLNSSAVFNYAPGVIAIDTDGSLDIQNIATNYSGETTDLLLDNILATNNKFQITGWAYWNGNPGNEVGFFGTSGTVGTSSGFGMTFKPSSSGVYVWTNNNQANIASTGAIPSKQKFHWAFTFDNATRQATLYINGQQVGQITTAVPAPAGVGFLRIGHNTDNGFQRTWDGYFDEVAIWNTISAPSTFVNQYKWGSDPVILFRPYFATAQALAVGESVYFDAMQLEQGTFATAFSPKADENLTATITQPQIAPGAVVGSGLATQTNLIINPRAGTDTNNWSIQGTGGETLTRSISLPTTNGLPNGITTGFAFTQSGSNTRYHHTSISVTSGLLYTFSAYVRMSTMSFGGVSVKIARPSFTQIWSSPQVTAVGGDFQRLSITFTAPATESIQLYIHSDSGASTVGHFTAVMFQQASVLNSYFDGATNPPNTSWTGTAHASSSTIGVGAIAPATIVGGDLVANTITAGQIAANTITAGQIAANTLTATEIAANAIGVSELAAQSITASKIAIGGLTDNLIINWSAEGNSVDGWENVDGTPTALTSVTSGSTSPVWHGDRIFRIDATSGASVGYGYRAIPVSPGKKYMFKIGLSHNNGTGTYYIRMFERITYPPSGDHVHTNNKTSFTDLASNISNSTIPTVTKEYTYTVPANIFWVTPSVYNWGASADGTLWFDAVEMREQVGTIAIADGVITATKIAANTITASEIAANAIGVSELAAQSVTATKIAVGGISDNLILNWSAEGASVDGWVLTEGTNLGLNSVLISDSPHGDYAFTITGNGATNAVYGYRAVPVKPGSKYAVRLHLKHSNGNGVYTIRVGEGADYPVTGDHLTSANRTSFTNLAASVANSTITSWSLKEYVYTVPTGIYWATFSVFNGGFSTGNLLFDAVEVREQISGSLIVDGAIDGKTITGALIRTAASPNPRVELAAAGLSGYDATGTNKTFFLNGLDGSTFMQGYVTTPVPATSIFTDADTYTFDADLGNWTHTATQGSATWTRTTTTTRTGAGAGDLAIPVGTTTHAGDIVANTNGTYLFDLNKTYQVEIWVRTTYTKITLLQLMIENTAAGDSATISTTPYAVNIQDVDFAIGAFWTQLKVQWTPSSNFTTNTRVRIRYVLQPTSVVGGAHVYFDDFKIIDVTPPASNQLSFRESSAGNRMGNLQSVRYDNNSITTLEAQSIGTTNSSASRLVVTDVNKRNFAEISAEYEPISAFDAFGRIRAKIYSPGYGDYLQKDLLFYTRDTLDSDFLFSNMENQKLFHCEVNRTGSTIAVAANGTTPITWNNEVYDNADMYNLATNATTIFIQRGGVYAVNIGLFLSAGTGEGDVRVYINAATVAVSPSTPIGTHAECNVTWIGRLNGGDQIQATTWASGGGSNTVSNQLVSRMCVAEIGNYHRST